MSVSVSSAPYPIDLSVDYPERPLDRLTTAFRIFWAVPILILAGAVGGGYVAVGNSTTYAAAGGAGGVLFAGPLLMIVFRQKYPKWWFDWNWPGPASRPGSRSTWHSWTIAIPPLTTNNQCAFRFPIQTHPAT
jgi:hypothetical protein